jgi:AP-2 complex subunit beta-1
MVAQTFIRNAAGKALVDSPALNAHSRAVLIPLARNTPAPANVSIPGPGPSETHTRKSPPIPADAGMNTSKPPPPIPTESNSGSNDLLDMNESTTSADDDDDDDAVTHEADDPYSNMDGAFGSYLADEPQPMGKSQRGDLDDLLF